MALQFDPTSSKRVLESQTNERVDGATTSGVKVHFADLSKRPPLMRVVFSFKMHDLIKEIQIPTYGDRAATARYLNGLYHDVRLIEQSLQQFELPFSNLDVLYRTNEIQKDQAAMRSVREASDLVGYFDHAGHFASIARSPHRLLAHFTVHNLGFLSGGQTFATTLSRNFGEDTVNLYRYPEKNPHNLLTAYNEELQRYLNGLTEEEFAEFQEEANLAWVFICDLFGRDVRVAKSRCEAVQRAWNQCKRFAWNYTPSALGWLWQKKSKAQ